MTDPTLSTLAVMGLVFGGAAVARILLRAVLVLNAMLHELTAAPAKPAAPAPPCPAYLLEAA